MADESGRRIKDAGQKIGGARKDKWAARGLALDDLETMTADEAHRFVAKDEIWPAPDYEALVAGGMPRDVAAFVKVARDRMAARPKAESDPAMADMLRRGYVAMVSAVRDFSLAAKSLDDFRDVERTLAQMVGLQYPKVRYRGTDEHRMFVSVYKDRHAPFSLRLGDKRRITEMVESGFPGKVKPWLKGLVIKNFDGEFHVVKGRQIVSPVPGFKTAEAADAWAEQVYKAALQVKAGNRKETPDRPHLERFDRLGLPDRRGGRHVSPEELCETFAFRGIEFGLWLQDDERQIVVDLAYDALHDLAEALDLPPTAISLGGRLGVAFGARGSGAHAAHYESVYRALNLTRLRGGGSLAHEWLHGLDHFAGEADVADLAGDVRSGSGWRGSLENRAAHLKNLTPGEAMAWQRVMDTIQWSPLTKEEAIGKAKSTLANYQAEIARVVKMLEDHKAKNEPGQRNMKWMREVEAWLKRAPTRSQAVAERVAKVEASPEDTAFGNKDSDYMKESAKVGGEYWKRANELFARAGEAFIFDRLAAKGALSPYLVQGVEETRFESDLFSGNPYPTGAERKRLADAYSELFAAMAPRLSREPDQELAP